MITIRICITKPKTAFAMTLIPVTSVPLATCRSHHESANHNCADRVVATQKTNATTYIQHTGFGSYRFGSRPVRCTGCLAGLSVHRCRRTQICFILGHRPCSSHDCFGLFVFGLVVPLLSSCTIARMCWAVCVLGLFRVCVTSEF